MKECVIWTVNLDRKKSRAEGRRIPKRFSLPNVKLSELVEACSELNLDFRVEEKKYPKCWWEEGGRVVVRRDGRSKTEIMIELAKKISEIRERKREKREKREKKEKKKKKK